MKSDFMDETPDEFLCPILQTLLEDPVMTLDGHTFERKAIAEWFSRGNLTNPLTNKKLQGLHLIPNRALKLATERYRKKMPELQREKEIKEHQTKLLQMLEKVWKEGKIQNNEEEKTQLQELRSLISKEIAILLQERKKIQIQREKLNEERAAFLKQTKPILKPQNRQNSPLIKPVSPKRHYSPAISPPRRSNSPIISKPIRRRSPESPQIKVTRGSTKFERSVPERKIDGAANMNFIMLGGASSGKSTALGHLLYKHGGVKKVTLGQIKSIEEECGEKGCMSSKYAWILDKDKKSRDHKMTTMVTKKQIQTQKFLSTIIDVPGSRNYKNTLMRTMTMADVGILMVPASPGQFQQSIKPLGPIRQHCLVAFTLGIKQMIVCINKMDLRSVDYSEKRYQQIKRQLQQLLKKIGFRVQNINFVPLSAWEGQNLTEKSSKTPWYKGPTLIQSMQLLVPPKRPTDKPLRLLVEKHLEKKDVIIGIISTGKIAEQQRVTICPGNINATVVSIQQCDFPVRESKAGSIVGVKLKFDHKKPNLKIKSGSVLGQPRNDPPRQQESIQSQIVVLDWPRPIKPGFKCSLICGTAKYPTTLESFESLIDRRTGRAIEQNPKSIKMGQSLIGKLKFENFGCCETFFEYPPLGRFALRAGDVIFAVGIVKNKYPIETKQK